MKKYVIFILMSLTIVAGIALTGCGENKQGTAEEPATTEGATANELETAGTTEIIEDTPEVEISSTEATVGSIPSRGKERNLYH